MRTTAEPSGVPAQGGDPEPPRGAIAALGAELKPLFEIVEDLIKRAADIESEEIKRSRARVRLALLDAKGALQAFQRGRPPLEAPTRFAGHLRRRPWQSMGAATLALVALGVLIAGAGEE